MKTLLHERIRRIGARLLCTALACALSACCSSPAPTANRPSRPCPEGRGASQAPTPAPLGHARLSPASAWSPAVIAPYTVGRYVAGPRGDLLHESHVIYRLEQGVRVRRLPAEAILFPGEPPAPEPSGLALVRDGLQSELNEQRQLSRRLLEQAKQWDEGLRQLRQQSQALGEAARSGWTTAEQGRALSRRLEALEIQGQERTDVPSTNRVVPPSAPSR